MAMPLTWKIGAVAVAVLALIVGWNVSSEHYAQYRADEISKEATHAAEQNAQQAKERARQYHAKLAENLQQRREALYNNYQQINDQARQYQKAESIRAEQKLADARRVEASYLLGTNQQCLGGIVINRQGASFSQANGQAGHEIKCEGRKAAERLR